MLENLNHGEADLPSNAPEVAQTIYYRTYNRDINTIILRLLIVHKNILMLH